mgnify:CR=1 FL=1
MAEHVFSSHQSSFVSVFRKAFEMGQAGPELYRKYKSDSIRRRMFLMILFSLLLTPIAYTDIGAVMYLLIFILGLFSTVTVSNIKIPISFISFIVGFIIYLQYGSVFPLVTGVIITHTIILFYYGAHSVRNSIKEGDSILYAPIIFVLSIIWRFVSGLGYLKETLFPSKIKPVRN